MASPPLNPPRHVSKIPSAALLLLTSELPLLCLLCFALALLSSHISLLSSSLLSSLSFPPVFPPVPSARSPRGAVLFSLALPLSSVSLPLSHLSRSRSPTHLFYFIGCLELHSLLPHNSCFLDIREEKAREGWGGEGRERGEGRGGGGERRGGGKGPRGRRRCR